MEQCQLGKERFWRQPCRRRMFCNTQAGIKTHSYCSKKAEKRSIAIWHMAQGSHIRPSFYSTPTNAMKWPTNSESRRRSFIRAFGIFRPLFHSICGWSTGPSLIIVFRKGRCPAIRKKGPWCLALPLGRALASLPLLLDFPTCHIE